jgi:serine/threonine-protein kinase
MRAVRILAGSIIVSLLLSPQVAAADTATAEALFREGRRLMAAGELASACPKLAESHRVDPATGTLLALALCYERLGKTASAWASYSEAASRAKREQHAEREQAARERAAALEPTLSTLTIQITGKTQRLPGLVVERDGESVGSAAWNTPVPIDPGEHVLRASAEGHGRFEKRIRVGSERDRAIVEIPELEPLERSPVRSNARAQSTRSKPVDDQPSSLRTWGLVTAGVGVIALGVGTYFGLHAMGRNDASKDDCDGNVCGEAGWTARQDARTAGDISTLAFIGGGVLVATGVGLFVLGAPAEADHGARTQAHATFAPFATTKAYGAALSGAF